MNQEKTGAFIAQLRKERGNPQKRNGKKKALYRSKKQDKCAINPAMQPIVYIKKLCDGGL